MINIREMVKGISKNEIKYKVEENVAITKWGKRTKKIRKKK
jgi:hypothetical protein